MAARCETVLNTTMAEMETYHTQKGEDFRMLMTEHLDGEIAFYEQVTKSRSVTCVAEQQTGTHPAQERSPIIRSSTV
jgi:WASP-binding domain of Sorting nexin protein